MTNPAPAPAPKKDESVWQALALAGQMGYLIAIPAFVFGFGGAYLDRWLRTSPLMLTCGLLLALALSMLLVYRKIKPILNSQS